MKRCILVAAVLTACASAPPAVHFFGPTDKVWRVPLDGDPDGLVWDGALIVADSARDRLLRWDERKSFTLVATVPGEGKPGLGQPARLPGGAWLVPRFGHGQTGGLVEVAEGKEAKPKVGLDPTRKRIGLAVGPDGTVFVAYFTGHGDGGGIATLGADGAEHDLVPALGKPVGLAVHGEWLYYSDQAKNEVRKCRLPSCAAPELVATIPGADLLALDKEGNVYVGTKDGDVWRVGADGKTARVQSGLGRVRGVAVDDAHGRWFLAGRRDGKSFIQVISLNPD